MRRWPDRQMKTSRRYKTIVGCGEAGAPAPPETGADPRDEVCEAAHEGTVGALCEGLVAVERTAKKLDEKCWGPLSPWRGRVTPGAETVKLHPPHYKYTIKFLYGPKSRV